MTNLINRYHKRLQKVEVELEWLDCQTETIKRSEYYLAKPNIQTLELKATADKIYVAKEKRKEIIEKYINAIRDIIE